MNTQSYIDIESKLGSNHDKPLDVVLQYGKGIWVWDVEGNRYLDFLSGYSAVNQGHVHPKIMQTMIEQAQKLTLTSRAFRNDQLAPFYKEICELKGSQKVLMMNSGAEAVEGAIKAVRKWGYKIKGVPKDKAEIIVCRNNFHGRTTSIVGFSSSEQSKDGFGPFASGFKTIPFDNLMYLKNAITDNTVAFLVEPIQGEAGILIPSQGYLKGVKYICEDNNVLTIFDEIQTGLGRTGKLLAEEHEGVKADITLLGKALSGGFYPVSAVLSSDEILGVFTPGDHGSTFGANPLACAVARTAVKVLVEEGMIENSAKMGEYFLSQLKSLKSPHIKEIRGKGLLIGVELTDESKGARSFCEKLMKHGLLCKETHENIIRFAPPLIIIKENIDWAMEIIRPILEKE